MTSAGAGAQRRPAEQQHDAGRYPIDMRSAESSTSEGPASSARPVRRGLTPQRLYGVVATAEMVTWALLITGMIARYGFDFDALMFPVGLAHGTAFVSYAVVSGLVALNQRWRFGMVVGAVALAVVPFATYPFDRWLNRRGMLEGGWRRQATDDPRDSTLVDRLLRFSLRHPVALVLTLAAVVAIVVITLLQLGPPTQWFS